MLMYVVCEVKKDYDGYTVQHQVRGVFDDPERAEGFKRVIGPLWGTTLETECWTLNAVSKARDFYCISDGKDAPPLRDDVQSSHDE